MPGDDFAGPDASSHLNGLRLHLTLLASEVARRLLALAGEAGF
jgi:hypothetical protein